MNLLSALFLHAERRRAFRDLSQLDEHLLRDIGLNRFDLRTTMKGPRTARYQDNREHV